VSWHQLDCLASTVCENEVPKPFQRTGFRTGLVDGRQVRVAFVPSSNRWIVDALVPREMSE
jgi:hypothetical protein